MSIDALQEKIRKLKCPIVLDLSVEPEHIPQALWESADEKAMTVYCKALMSGLKGMIPAVRFSFDQFALMGASAEAGKKAPVILLIVVQILFFATIFMPRVTRNTEGNAIQIPFTR